MCLKDRALSLLQMGNTILRAVFLIRADIKTQTHELELKGGLNKILGL